MSQLVEEKEHLIFVLQEEFKTKIADQITKVVFDEYDKSKQKIAEERARIEKLSLSSLRREVRVIKRNKIKDMKRESE